MDNDRHVGPLCPQVVALQLLQVTEGKERKMSSLLKLAISELYMFQQLGLSELGRRSHLMSVPSLVGCVHKSTRRGPVPA